MLKLFIELLVIILFVVAIALGIWNLIPGFFKVVIILVIIVGFIKSRPK